MAGGGPGAPHRRGGAAEHSLRRASDEKLASWPGRHHGEVREAEQLIEQIGQRSPLGDDWLPLVQRLKSALETHIQEEEQEIWPRIERVWDAKQLERAGAEMEAMGRQGSAAKDK
jgi:hypothetical protein